MSEPTAPSMPNSSHNAPHPSTTSIALIAASLLSFIFFVFISVHRRPSRHALATPSPPVTNKPPAKRKPKLWEVFLDEGHHPELTRLDGAPISAWTDNNNPLARSPRSRQASAPPRALPEPVMDHHVAMAQAWFHGTYPLPRRPTHLPAPHPPAPPPIPDHRTINVAVLVVMPSRRPQPMHGTTPHHPIGSRLSYAEGQLSIGTTSLSCSR